jgi:exonuclease SbcC
MIPKHLRLKNFLSHDASEIDFDQFKIALILGMYDGDPDRSNGAGKSGILESIRWALFGKSRHKQKSGVVKWDRRACEVEYEFLIDDCPYKIVRTTDKTANDTDVSLSQWSNEKQEYGNISCDSPTATNEKIVDTIGFDDEVFINSVYFKQNDISMFATSTPGKRKDIVKSLLKMDQWDDYQKKAKDNAKRLDIQIEEKSQRLIPIETIRRATEKCKGELNVLKQQIKSANQDLAKLNSDLMTKKISYQSIYCNTTDNDAELKKMQREFADTKKRLDDIKQSKENNDSSIVSCTGQIASLQQKMAILNDRINVGQGIDLADMRSKIVVGRTKEGLLREKISALKKELVLNNECDLCGRPLNKKEIEDVKHKRQKLLVDTEMQLQDIHQKLLRAEEKLQQKETAVSEATKSELEKSRSDLKISKLQSTLDECIADNSRINKEQLALSSRDFGREIEALKSRLNKDTGARLKKEIDDTEKQYQDLKRKSDRFNIDYGSKISQRDELVKSESAQLALQKEIDRIKDEYSVYDKLKEYFGKDGIQSVIIENVLGELENYSNDTLSKICNEPTSISIVTQKQSDNGSWSETFDINVKEGARTDRFETFSGGEQFRVSLALRLALSSILTKRSGTSVKFLLLDEVTSNLDKRGLEMFISTVKALSEHMKVLVITHDEKLKDRFSNVIMVEKTSTGSKIVVH